ncbi:tyrosine-type recombinase/integrase [Nocardioides campestrisoli]|uniref:tyrosine-type recombinase/integrase n=1 Tax=Nocardioides campestrisoli TaxID=2736757 RepID=UPI00163D766C|nr:tyrosine-type recombinase/integrase [Nocardioides campestrisoli]
MPPSPKRLDLPSLLSSWEVGLRAERKSPQTVKSYTTGVTQYLAYCAAHGRPAVLDRRTLALFVDDLLSKGLQASTATSRQLGVRRFSAWLVEEGELDADPLLGVKSPKIDTKVIEPLVEEQIKALIKACAGKDLRERRDEAIVRFMAETGARAGEVVGLAVHDVDVRNGTAIIRRGKGGKGRTVPFGPQTGLALDRYLRTRRGHSLSDRTDALWLGDRGKGFSYDALHKSLAHRAALAGIEGFRPHLLRHTAAHRWLAAGGSEGGLMAVAGWTRPDMLLRYTKAQASARAAQEARALGLGDF